jgi:Family of unknown function (DUF6516)
MIANMRAVLLLRSKEVLADGAVVEMVLWRLPKPLAGSSHMYKYRLHYGRDGVLVGYDKERLKGDHRHLDGKESSYSFTSVDQLVSDFLADVRARRTRR